MVWISWGGGRRRGYGPRGYGGGYGRGFGVGYGGGYGRGPRGGGGGCLRDLFLLNTGCCLAESLGCGPALLLAAPSALARAPRSRPAGTTRAEGLVHLYRDRLRPRHRPSVCRLTPSCSAYALGALHDHGTARGLALAAARLLRCRPGGPTGTDPVPPVARAA